MRVLRRARVTGAGVLMALAPIALPPTIVLGQPLQGRQSTTVFPSPSGLDGINRARIVHQARVFGDATSASGERVWAVTDADLTPLRGHPAALARRLAGPDVGTGDAGRRTRRVGVVVALRRPLTVSAASGRPANIGVTTAGVVPGRQLDVHTYISTTRISVVRGRP